ncbi:glycerol-3-phosphate acyltransferase [Dehalococcoidales bacterium]|nr:glycerol-3-phosphate acyltransferase [Dehalococcoidales bacterium]MCL0094737.1 glycerol-3-phosphate acyltransferase [Dehalococcoidales bacterium]
MEFVLLVLTAYLLGSVPAAYLAARFSQGIDIRQYGSGNVGLANLWRLTAKWLAILVAIFDLAKGMVMVWTAQLLGLGIGEQVAVGLAAIIGHNWSVFLGFSGGRGILTTLGVVFILMPWGLAVFCAIVAIGMLIIRSSPLPVLAGIVSLPLVSWGFGQPIAVSLGFLAIFLLVVIRRLTAPPPVTVSIGRKQLLVNRLLFDRDIRDRKAWVERQPTDEQSPK